MALNYNVADGVTKMFAGLKGKTAHVWLGSGQSNYQGRGVIGESPIADNTPIGSIKTWRRNINGGELYTGTGQWYDLEYDTNQYESRDEFGSILKLAMNVRDNIEDANNDCFLISPDANGEDIFGWTEGNGSATSDDEFTAVYNGHITPALADLVASGLYDNIYIHGFLWYQGEGDCNDQTKADLYDGRLQGIIDYLRTFLSIPHLPVVIVRVYRPTATWSGIPAAVAAVQQAQDDITARNANVRLIEGPFALTSDNLHINGVAQNGVGDSAFNFYQQLTSGEKYHG